MKSMGFIGSGRAARIMLGGLRHADALNFNVVASDISQDVIGGFVKEFPGVRAAGSDNSIPAGCDYVFISLHPPVFIDELKKVSGCIKKDAVVISLAPKIKIAKIREITGVKNIVRLIPNSPSIIGKGYNPVVFSEGFDPSIKNEMASLFGNLGVLPEVKEETLEAYAVITAMGPTYFLYQWEEMFSLAKEFGLSEKDAMDGVTQMLSGTLSLFSEPGMTFAAKNDLIPVKPLAEGEDKIRGIFRDGLNSIYAKLSS